MDIERENVAIRLVEERERLGFSQRDFADKAGITLNGLRNYESGERWASTKFLIDAAALGVDVQYVLTGVRSPNRNEVEKKVSHPVVINGSANVIGVVENGATINQYNTERIVTRVTAEVKPGEEHISEAQAARLTKLVKDVVDLEEKLKQRPKSFRAVWSALNAHVGVTRYRLIPAESFDKAEKYLLKWIGRLNSMASAPTKNEADWRKSRYAYIKLNSKNDPKALTDYMQLNFGASSLTELSDGELEKVYRYIAGRKSAKKRA